LNSGGLIDEVDRACRPIREAAQLGADAGTAEFLRSWIAVADGLIASGEADEGRGRNLAAGRTYVRAVNYLTQAERMQSPHSADRLVTYRRCLGLMERAFALADPLTTRVLVPFGDTTLPAYLTTAPPAADGAPAPCVVMWNGLDSTKEHMYTSGFSLECAQRGVSTLMVDCPGSGEALRLQGLVAIPQTEVWAAACVDYLQARQDVDPSRIGLVGWSLGGYYAPRAAAFEKRLALCVAWGANHDWGAVQRRRRDREGERPVPHYWDHVLWVWGESDIEGFLEMADHVRLDGVVDKIDVPFLVLHGENDRQIPVADAYRSYEQATASPKRELRVFTAAEGGAEHIGLDNLPHVAAFVADWVAETFAELATDCGTPASELRRHAPQVPA